MNEIIYIFNTCGRRKQTMNYEESRAYIRAAELKKGIVLGLENMRELMRRLGNPQDELKYVHEIGRASCRERV